MQTQKRVGVIPVTTVDVMKVDYHQGGIGLVESTSGNAMPSAPLPMMR